MKLYRFSPIISERGLIEAIKHTHFACFELCRYSFDKYLPVAGNMGIFCHYDDEYKFLIEVRKKLTEESKNVNQKYFRLNNPIVIPARENIPETTYTFLYIRKPDPYRFHVGDVDFVLEKGKYQELKKSLQGGKAIKGARIFERSDLDMVELYDPEIDALGYVSPREMTEKGYDKKSKMSSLGLQRGIVQLKPYNPEWQKLFETENSALQEILGEKFIAVEHVGSTAIPELKAKPILDLMLAIPDLNNWAWLKESLSKLGYEFRRDFRTELGHILFVKGPEENRTHYLKITELNSDFWTEHILFRDYLINNPQHLAEYQNLKEKLFDAHSGNSGPYTKGKEEFVRKILKLAGHKGKIL